MPNQKIRKMGSLGVESKNGPLFMCLKHRLKVELKTNRNFGIFVAEQLSDFLAIFQTYANFL